MSAPRIGISNDPSGPTLPPAVRATGLMLTPKLKGPRGPRGKMGAPVGSC